MAYEALSLCFLLCSAALASGGSGEGIFDPHERGCDAAREVYHNALDVDGARDDVYQDLQNAEVPSICRLSKTCCDRTVEQNLSSLAEEQLRERVAGLWELKTSTCRSSTFKDALTTFIEDSKLYLLELLDTAYFGFFTRRTLFDEFYNYLNQAVTTTNTCKIGYKFNKLFFEIFLAVLEADPGVDTTLYRTEDREFNVCMYDYYLELFGEETHSRFIALTRSFNRTLYYIRALNTAESILELLAELEYTPQCKHALMRSGYCAQCGGVPTSIQPCHELCLNTLRGCLVDYTDLFDPYLKFTEAAVRMKEYLDEFVNPFNHVGQQLISGFFEAISDTERRSRLIHQEILIRCLGSRGRRDTETETKRAGDYPRSIFTRATLPPPSDIFNQSAYCLLEVAPLFRDIPSRVCSDVSAHPESQSCWNGKSIDRYQRNVLNFTREGQIDNPEMIVCPTLPRQVRVQLGRLKRVTQEMNIITRSEVCPEDDEDCTVNDQRCNFTTFAPVSVETTDSMTTQGMSDAEDASRASGSSSGCGFDAGSGFGSGSGECKPEIMEEVEECLVDPLVPSVTVVPTPTTTVVQLPSPSSVEPSRTVVPTATPPTKEPPIVIVTQAGCPALLPSALLLSLLCSITLLQSVL